MQSNMYFTGFSRSKNFQSYELFQMHAKNTEIFIDQIETCLKKTLDFKFNPPG